MIDNTLTRVKQGSPKMVAAMALAEDFGWPILPVWGVAKGGGCACGRADCGSPGKHPIAMLAPRGLHDATTDLKTIESWWARYPEANIGVRTGGACWVLDLDGADGIRAFDRLCEKQDLPTGPASRTGGGGRHLFFAPDSRVKNAAKLGGQSIDCRGEGGYVLVPVSDHASGDRYGWERSPSEYKLQPAPSWLLEFVTNGKPYDKRRAPIYRIRDGLPPVCF